MHPEEQIQRLRRLRRLRFDAARLPPFRRKYGKQAVEEARRELAATRTEISRADKARVKLKNMLGKR
jgi:hypothetical protein